MSFGVCLPIQCSKADFIAFLPHLMPLIDEHIIPYQFSNANELDKDLKYVRLSADELEFVDSVAENEKVARWGFGTVVVFLLYLMLWGIVIGSTSLNWF